MMRPALVVAALMLASPAAAQACDDGDQALFSCHVLDGHENPDDSEAGFSLCGGHDGDLDHWTRVYYEFWTAKGVELRYPGPGMEGKSRFFTHNYSEDGLYRFRVRFDNGGYRYVLYLDESSAATEPDTINGPSAGVEVLKNGKRVGLHECSEAPETYFAYTFRATSCDLENPLGRAACDENHAPELK